MAKLVSVVLSVLLDDLSEKSVVSNGFGRVHALVDKLLLVQLISWVCTMSLTAGPLISGVSCMLADDISGSDVGCTLGAGSGTGSGAGSSSIGMLE